MSYIKTLLCHHDVYDCCEETRGPDPEPPADERQYHTEMALYYWGAVAQQEGAYTPAEYRRAERDYLASLAGMPLTELRTEASRACDAWLSVAPQPAPRNPVSCGDCGPNHVCF